MTGPAPIDPEGRLLLTVRRAALEHEQAVLLAQLARELDEAGDDARLLRPDPRAAAGDPASLRGLPVVGVRGGFGGAIRGTRPGDGIRN